MLFFEPRFVRVPLADAVAQALCPMSPAEYLQAVLDADVPPINFLQHRIKQCTISSNAQGMHGTTDFSFSNQADTKMASAKEEGGAFKSIGNRRND